MGAKHLGIKATIVMPRTTPQIKVDAVRSRGAKVVLHGDSYDEASAHAQELVEQKGLTYIHPLDRKSTRLNSSHVAISYAVFCLKKKKYYNKIFLDKERIFVPISNLKFEMY